WLLSVSLAGMLLFAPEHYFCVSRSWGITPLEADFKPVVFSPRSSTGKLWGMSPKGRLQMRWSLS
ncbi:MAG TPA: hypothetical protein VGL94_18295, partial [Ktedonobacteraceae bacterium]